MGKQVLSIEQMNLNMKTITIYQTNDGCRFDNKEEAMKYEELCDKCNEIESRLVNIARELEYNEYIQQDLTVVKNVLNRFMDIVAEAIPEYASWTIQVKNGGRQMFHIGRIIDDYNIKCLWKLYYRFSCIDFNNGKEFQQPYFVVHQNDATIKVN